MKMVKARSLRLSVKNAGPEIKSIIKIVAFYAHKYGIKSYLVGGFVRDYFLRRKTFDLDFTFESNPSFVAESAAKELDVPLKKHPEFLTYSLKTKHGVDVDFATFRSEEYPHPACLPKVYDGSLEEDLFRRDFTINAVCCRLNYKSDKFEVVDLYGGLESLEGKELKILHFKSFMDDPSRIFRLARFMVRFGFKPDVLTSLALKAALEVKMVARLSLTRVKHELSIVFNEPDPGAVIRLLMSWGAIEQIDGFCAESKKFNFPKSGGLGYLNYAVLFKHIKQFELAKLLDKMQFSNSEKKGITTFVNIAQNPNDLILLSGMLAVSASKEFLRCLGLSNPQIRALHSLDKTRSLIKGSDLKKWGYKPGPVFKDILFFVSQALTAGKIKSYEQAKKLIFDNFPL